MDALKNFSYSLVATAPSPATSGTSLVVTAGQGSYFPATPFDATIWPSGAQPTNTNAEIVRVTNVSTDTFTITRAQYGTTAQSIAVGYQIAQTVDANLLNQLAPLSGATFTGEVVAPDFKASGLTGATVATRYVGGTTNGAPTSGTFAVGDFIVDQTATIWVCTTAGTPGTWWSTISNHAVLRTATATAGKNEVTIFSGSTASQTISAVGSPVDGATWTFINQGTVNVTAGFASNSMYPLGSGSSVTSYVIAPNSSYTFINYNGGNWYMTSTNDLDNGTGIVKVTNGGTGTSTAPAVGSIPVATSTSAYTPLAIGTSGQVLQSNGTTATWSSSTALATVNLTAQSAAQAATTLYTPASDGLFTITYYAKVTTAATTSSTLGVFSVISTDVDSNVVTTVGQSSQQNSLTAGFISGSITVYAKASTAIQYSLGYASSGATAMQYELHVVVAGTIAPSSTGTVSSFNGRTGAVTPGSSDYTPAQVGAVDANENIAGKNFIINGGMDIWQRGTSFSIATGVLTYTADRWCSYPGVSTWTVSQLAPATITAISSTSTTWTFTVANNFQAGQLVIISGCTPTGYNGTWTIATASSTQFTVTNSSNPGTGTVFGTATTVAQGFKNAMRVQRNSGTTSTAGFAFTQSLETQNSLPLAGKTVTLSFWARASSSISSNSLSAYITYGQGTDQNTIYGFTNQANFNQTFTTTSGWALYTLSNYTLPTNITQVGLYFFYTPVGTAGANDYFDITGVQLEIGSTATAFSRAGGTIQGELAACQRYYAKSYNQNVAPATGSSASGIVFTPCYGNAASGQELASIWYPITMRAVPTVYIYSYTSGTLSVVSNGTGADLAANSGSTQWIGDARCTVFNGSGGSITPNYGGFIFHYAVSAEL